VEELEKVTIRRIIGPTPQGAAVLVGNEKKTFAVFVGPYEAAAMVREINHEKLPRPLTHELIQNVFLGFDVGVKQVIVSDLADQTYYATLVLEQRLKGSDGSPTGQRNEVRIDARPSDCFVLALKTNADIFVTRDVFDQVEDVSSQPHQFFSLGGVVQGAEEADVDIPDGLGDELDAALGGEDEREEDTDSDED
jgi:bifunctional DNase/RNase